MKNKLLNTIFGLSIIYMVNTNSELLFAKDVYLGGNSIGIEMKKNGVIVSGTYDIIINNKVYNPSKDSNIKIGDVIYEVDNNEIKFNPWPKHFWGNVELGRLTLSKNDSII